MKNEKIPLKTLYSLSFIGCFRYLILILSDVAGNIHFFLYKTSLYKI